MSKFTLIAITVSTLTVTAASAQAEFNIIYDRNSGNLSLTSPDRSVTTFEAKSAGNLFIPENIAPGVLAPPFDLITPAKLFKLSAGAGAYHSIDFGNVLPGGLPCEEVLADLTISGSLTPDGSGNNAFESKFSCIPEPSSVTLISFGLLGLLSFRRSRASLERP